MKSVFHPSAILLGAPIPEPVPKTMRWRCLSSPSAIIKQADARLAAPFRIPQWSGTALRWYWQRLSLTTEPWLQLIWYHYYTAFDVLVLARRTQIIEYIEHDFISSPRSRRSPRLRIITITNMVEYRLHRFHANDIKRR